ncbi:MAG: beta-glucuronidase [Bacteroidetes bacterium]|nr:beta-glucuronidase [Bacteroidota bacterium]
MNRKFLLVVFVCFFQIVRGQEMDLYLLAGQSNMAGRGPVDAESKETDARILMLDKNNNWVPATDPVHFDKPDVVGVGPGIAFAKEMSRGGAAGAGGRGGKVIGLIPCAVGGSPIRVWEYDSTYLNGLHPYDDAIRRAKVAMGRGKLKGIVWHQGESDNNPADAAVYMNKLKALVQRFRNDLNEPGLPFVAGEIGYFNKEVLINKVIDEIPGAVTNTAVVSAAGLTDKGDKVHFDTRSARELGRRYAAAMKGLQAGSPGGLVSGGAQGDGGLIQNIGARVEQSLDGRWNYIVDPYENGYYDYRHMPYDQSASGTGGFFDDKKAKDKTELIEYNFDLSPTLKVPGDWNSQDEKLYFYEGTVWYRRLFHVAQQPGRRYFLYFGAVNYEAHVYLNGKKLGMHKGGFTPFQFEVTGKLKEGENSIVVKADNTRKQDEIPTVNTDWWNYGGMTRDVVLASTPATFIADYKVQLAKDEPGRIEGFVQLDGSGLSQEVVVSIPEAGIKQTVKTDASGRAVLSIPVKKLDYWSPEHPRLYAVQLQAGTDVINDKIGFRTIQVKGQDILLNGKSVFLRGISIHDENPLIQGRNRGEGDLRMLLTWAKEMNCNYVRLAHYPHNEAMIRLADEMGLMIWAEVPVYWTISWENAGTFANAQKQLSDLIIRDKNRASVIIWSIGNETPLSDARLSFMSKLAERAHSLDNTRLVSAALEVHRKGDEAFVDDPLGEKLDLVSFNEYAGWYWGDKPTDLPKYHFTIKYNRPVVITEFGGDALAGFHADSLTRFSEEYQELLYKNQLQMLMGIGALRGTTPWILTDFRSPRRQHPVYQNYWNRKGLISETGQKKKAFYVLKSFYEEMERKYK